MAAHPSLSSNKGLPSLSASLRELSKIPSLRADKAGAASLLASLHSGSSSIGSKQHRQPPRDGDKDTTAGAAHDEAARLLFAASLATSSTSSSPRTLKKCRPVSGHSSGTSEGHHVAVDELCRRTKAARAREEETERKKQEHAARVKEDEERRRRDVHDAPVAECPLLHQRLHTTDRVIPPQPPPSRSKHEQERAASFSVRHEGVEVRKKLDDNEFIRHFHEDAMKHYAMEAAKRDEAQQKEERTMACVIDHGKKLAREEVDDVLRRLREETDARRKDERRKLEEKYLSPSRNQRQRPASSKAASASRKTPRSSGNQQKSSPTRVVVAKSSSSDDVEAPAE